MGIKFQYNLFRRHSTPLSLVTSTHTIRRGIQDRPITEKEEEWQTQSTVLTMVFTTGTVPQKFPQTQNQVQRMSH